MQWLKFAKVRINQIQSHLSCNLWMLTYNQLRTEFEDTCYVVGHLLQKIFHISFLFIQRERMICCQVLGHNKLSKN